MKKIVAFVLAVCLLAALAVVPAAAAGTVASGACGLKEGVDDLKWTLDSDGTLTVSGKGRMASFWDGPPWKSKKEQIKTVIIKDGVTTIGSYAFDGCKNLSRVEIPASVMSIPEGTFTGTAIYDNESNWENGVLYIGSALIACKGSFGGAYTVKPGTTVIATRAFFFSDMTACTLPASLKSIDGNAFEYCTKLASINLPNGLKNIGNFAFQDCSALKSLTIPDSVERIGACAFNRSGLYDDGSNWENDIFYIGNAAISLEPDAVKGDFSIRAGTRIIADRAFHHTQVGSPSFPDSVRFLGDETFTACDVRKANIPSGVKTIGEQLFAFNRGMTQVAIPASVKVIESAAFQETALTDVYFGGSAAEWAAIAVDWSGGFNDKLKTAAIHYNASGFAPDPNGPSSWAEAEVRAAIAAGLVPEALQKDYKEPTTRGAVAQMFIDLIEQSTGKSIEQVMADKGVAVDPSVFSDTGDRAVLAANALGIINGIGGGKFDPEGSLTRGQIAAIMNRTAKALGIDTAGYTHSFTDVAGSWVDAELGWPVHAGIIKGVGDNRFDPDGTLSAEQAIVITYRAYKVLAG